MWYSKLAHGALAKLSKKLPFDVAVQVSKELLAAQGFGAGGSLRSSGERGVFHLIEAEAPLLFDVGGHVGEYTQAFLQACPGGRSYVFEPSAAHLARLRENLAGLASVEIFPFGLGATSGEVPLFKDREVSGLASLSQRRLDHFGISMDLSETVSIRTIDSVTAERGFPAIDLLKIDVEGHELAVLSGARETFRKGLIKLVQFEFGGCNLDTRTNLQDFFYAFKEYDFLIALVLPSGRCQVIGYDEFFEHYRTTNFVAAPRNVLGG